MKAEDIEPPFLLGEYHTSNWMPFVPHQTPNGLEIKAGPTPAKGIVATTAVIAAVFAGFYWFLAVKAPEAVWVVVAIGGLTTVATPVLIFLHYRSEQDHGPVLILDEKSGMLNLLRNSKRVAIPDLDCIAIVTAHDGSSDWKSQLQIHTKARERLPLVTADTPRELEQMAKAISSAAAIPIRYYRQQDKKSAREESAEE